MIPPIDKVPDEGNCGRATDRGEEACECVVKLTNLRRACRSIVVGRILVKAARLRTETSTTNATASVPGRAGQASDHTGTDRRRRIGRRSRSRIADLVNGELVQRNITLLSGETCRDGMRVVAAPISKACLKTRNELAQADSGAAGISRGHSTDSRRPIETGRTER